MEAFDATIHINNEDTGVADDWMILGTGRAREEENFNSNDSD